MGLAYGVRVRYSLYRIGLNKKNENDVFKKINKIVKIKDIFYTKSVFNTKHRLNTNFSFEDWYFVVNGYFHTEFVLKH